MSSRVAYNASTLAGASFAQEQESRSSTANHVRSSARDHGSGSSSDAQLRGRSAAGSDFRVIAEKVLRSFNTWSFKREQPSDPQLMLRFIADAIAAQEPIRFVLYWGKVQDAT